VCAKKPIARIVNEILDDRDAGNNSVSVSQIHRMLRDNYGAKFAITTMFRHIRECRK
jgi:hypothetical protein